MPLFHTMLRRLTLLMATALVLACLAGELPASAERKRILILNSYTTEDLWTAKVNQGIFSVFRERGVDVEFLVEEIGITRTMPALYLPELRTLLQKRYTSIPLDLIITTENNALNFALEQVGAALPDVPIVFSSLTDRHLIRRFPDERATGVFSEDSALFLLRELIRLHGDIPKIALLVDRTPRGFMDLARLRDAAITLSFPTQRIFPYIGLSIEEMMDSFAKLPPNSVVLLGNFSVSVGGRLIPLPTVVEAIQSANELSTYSLLEETAALGVLGTVTGGGSQIGRMAGEIALKVLGGTATETIPLARGANNRLIFNYAEVKNLGIQRSSLPPGSILHGDPFQEINRFVPLIAGNILLFIILGSSAFILRRKIKARKIAESELFRQSESWKNLFENSPQGIIIYDILGQIKETNSRFRELFRLTDGIPQVGIMSLLAGTGTVFTEEEVFPSFMTNLATSVKSKETKVPDGEGGTIPVSFLTFPLPSVSEEDVYCALFEDISERKRLQAMLRRRTALQKQVTAISSRFVMEGEFGETMKVALGDILNLSGARFASIYVMSETGALVPEIEIFPEGRMERRPNGDDPLFGEDFFWKSLLKKDPLPTVLLVEPSIRDHRLKRDGLHGRIALMPLLLNRNLQGFLALVDPLPRWYDASDEPMLALFSELLSIAIERKREEDALRKAHEIILGRFSGAISVLRQVSELRDDSTSGHQKNVSELAESLAVEMNLPEETRMAVRYAGLVHDIGKLYIPAEILGKPSFLSEAEYELVKKHPEYGHNILSTLDFPWPLAKIVLQHHERVDGSGYPYGLTMGEICLEARILAVVDSYDAMVSDRPYRKSKGEQEALDELCDLAGSAYDPEIVQAFVSLRKKRAAGE
ncbi:MAG: HD domain-containing protein [Synergistaceae bacterium]|nr:HD domain-containing phosphohydrolase [Synergistota bacterium]NLM71386.1 HD domain-containing protein [Synergistaceae bacterium]